MAKRGDFNRDAKYNFDPDEILDEETGTAEDEFDFLGNLPEDNTTDDLDELLSDEFLTMLGIEPAAQEEEEVSFDKELFQDEPEEEEIEEIDEDFSEEIPVEFSEEIIEELPEEFSQEPEAVDYEDDDVKEYEVKPVPAFDVEPELDEEFIKTFEEVFPPEVEEASAQQSEVPVVDMPIEEPKREAPVRRRKKLSRERIIKEVYLPPIILGLTLILLITFIGSAIGRAIKTNKDQQEALKESQQQASSALEQEAASLIARADVLAKGYDYDAALSLLDSFSADKSQYPGMLDAYNAYTQAKAQLKPIDDPNTIPNLSFHCLIADPARAFSDKEFGKSYNTNYVTIDEFSKILDQLYANGYVLVDFNSFVLETTGEDGKVTYSSQPIFLPDGKKPIMLTETLVNYETFSIDSDGDMEADKGGDGFASKLVVKDGKIVNEYVDAEGNTLYGAYDLVPILEEFIAAHPDFCYRGARATLAVSGEDGLFGYRTMLSVKDKKGEEYYNAQVEGATKIAAALRDAGYTIASYTYANIGYGSISATKIQVDLDNWKKEVKPILGDVPVMIFAKASDIGVNYDSGNGKYNVLKDNGFRYFISSGNSPYTQINVNYVRQSRIMVTGQQMITYPQNFTNYFTVKDVLNDQRGS